MVTSQWGACSKTFPHSWKMPRLDRSLQPSRLAQRSVVVTQTDGQGLCSAEPWMWVEISMAQLH